MISRSPTAFNKSATGAWESVDRKYEVRREGLREVSFFAWPKQHAGADGPKYTWILAATSAAGKTSIGFETYATLFNAFFKTYQETNGLPSGLTNIVFDPDIETAMWDLWGP
jgi:hypothetical protein